MTSNDERFIKLGLKISYYRKFKGMSQIELAEKVNISRTHMSRIEAPNLKTSISLETLFNISNVLGVPIACFFQD